MSRVAVTMRDNRRYTLDSFGNGPQPEPLDAQDGQRLYEILASAGDGQNDDRWFEYRGSSTEVRDEPTNSLLRAPGERA